VWSHLSGFKAIHPLVAEHWGVGVSGGHHTSGSQPDYTSGTIQPGEKGEDTPEVRQHGTAGGNAYTVSLPMYLAWDEQSYDDEMTILDVRLRELEQEYTIPFAMKISSRMLKQREEGRPAVSGSDLLE
jgi:hypothetical protein